jgi:hypothetical protein
MRKTSLAIITLAPLAVLAGFALPAVAGSGEESAEVGEGSCFSGPAEPATGPIDLDKIPVKPVTGPQAVQGVDDECDDEAASNNGEDGLRTAIDVNDDGLSHEGLGDRDD